MKRTLDVRKASFRPQEWAVEASGMEYGGITPAGAPTLWRLPINLCYVEGRLYIGSGSRRSKFFISDGSLATLPGAEVIEGLTVE